MSYPGGKGASGAVQAIINQQPPHRIYIEAFLGGGAVIRAKRPAQQNFAFDIDSAAIDAFSDAAGSTTSAVLNSIDWLERPGFPLTREVLIYCDPPYLFSTRAWPHRRLYRYELEDGAHRRFLRAVRSLPCMVQISGYWSSLYEEMLADWRVVTFEAATRGTAINGRKATEYLWMNYREPTALHDYRYLGSNFRERERIKRRTSRWIRRLKAIPELERKALLSAITDHTSEKCDTGSGGELPIREKCDVGRRTSAASAPLAIPDGDRTSVRTGV